MDKNDALMATALIWAQCSTAERLKVGAILSKDNRILAQGYNGTLPGADNICEDANGLTKDSVVHAEQNLLMFAAKKGIATEGCVVHVTHSPCIFCAKLMISAGIKKVVYCHEYRSREGLELLREFGVHVVQREIDGL
jgi:dCMP deaminase